MKQMENEMNVNVPLEVIKASRSYLPKTRFSVVLVFADGRYTERIKAGCLMAGQSVFMMEVSKGGQGGTPLPTTSLQTKSESVIVGYTHSKNVV